MQKDGSRKNVVAKVSKDPNEDKNTYYRDVQAQACAKLWAMEYNDCGTPKVIDFVPAYVFELVDRPVCAALLRRGRALSRKRPCVTGRVGRGAR